MPSFPTGEIVLDVNDDAVDFALMRELQALGLDCVGATVSRQDLAQRWLRTGLRDDDLNDGLYRLMEHGYINSSDPLLGADAEIIALVSLAAHRGTSPFTALGAAYRSVRARWVLWTTSRRSRAFAVDLDGLTPTEWTR